MLLTSEGSVLVIHVLLFQIEFAHIPVRLYTLVVSYLGIDYTVVWAPPLDLDPFLILTIPLLIHHGY